MAQSDQLAGGRTYVVEDGAEGDANALARVDETEHGVRAATTRIKSPTGSGAASSGPSIDLCALMHETLSLCPLGSTIHSSAPCLSHSSPASPPFPLFSLNPLTRRTDRDSLSVWRGGHIQEYEGLGLGLEVAEVDEDQRERQPRHGHERKRQQHVPAEKEDCLSACHSLVRATSVCHGMYRNFRGKHTVVQPGAHARKKAATCYDCVFV
jgi:hypothetical protein